MRARASYVAVGLFVLLLGAALIAGVLWLTTGGAPRAYAYYFVYITDSVSGLNIDAPVKYRGVDRGRVSKIELDPDDPERVRLLLLVQVGTPINAETVATLQYSGLTGVASINLSGGSRDSPPLRKQPGEEYPVIQSQPSLLARLDETASELIGSFVETSRRINAFLDERNRTAVTDTLQNMATLSAQLDERLGELATLLGNADGLISELREGSAALPGVLERFSRSAAALEQMADTLAAAGGELGATGASLRRTAETSGRDLQRFTATALPEAQAMVADLRFAAENLRRASETLSRDPRALLFGPPAPEPGPGEPGQRR